jgi:hypothetical protein
MQKPDETAVRVMQPDDPASSRARADDPSTVLMTVSRWLIALGYVGQERATMRGTGAGRIQASAS